MGIGIDNPDFVEHRLKPRRRRMKDAVAAMAPWNNTIEEYWNQRDRVELQGDRIVFQAGPDVYGWRPPWITQDPAEAWEILATREVIPKEWVQNPRRRFMDLQGEKHPNPRSIPECISLAADVEGMLAAESIAQAIANAFSLELGTEENPILWFQMPADICQHFANQEHQRWLEADTKSLVDEEDLLGYQAWILATQTQSNLWLRDKTRELVPALMGLLQTGYVMGPGTMMKHPSFGDSKQKPSLIAPMWGPGDI